MSGGRLQAPRGTRDVLPDEAVARGELERAAERLLGGAGYGRLETPAFEATELFARGVGASTDIVQKEMYSFDDGGGRSVTLRPEGTAPVCRAYVEHGMHKQPQPVKLYYLSSFFRHERAQKGRQRQFWQIGAEALGSDAPELDAESIVLLADLLAAGGAAGLRLRLSSLGSPATRAAYREELQGHLRAHERQLAREVRERIGLNPLRAFDSDDPGTRVVMASAPRLLDRLEAEDAAHFAEVCRLLDVAGVKYELDGALVRGLDYYTRTVFEFESSALGAQRGVAGGGRYDGLVELLGGPPTAGVGWAAGVERMLLAGANRTPNARAVDLFVGFDQAGRTAAFGALLAARAAGLRAEMELADRSVKGQLKHAERLGARFAAIFESESSVVLRAAGSAAETRVDADELIDTVSAA